MKLSELYENPDNPSKCTDQQLQRLADKLKRVPLGLTAMRIAYVTDKIPDKKMVISGNKRLRVLKKAYGEDAELPDEWFQDVTAMSEAERHEFIVTANVSDGQWDLDMLLSQYGLDELQDFMDPQSLVSLIGRDLPQSDLGEDESSDGKDSSKDSKDPSTVDGVYRLGSCSLYCGDVDECDKIRKMYAEDRYGVSCDWQTLTPMIG